MIEVSAPSSATPDRLWALVAALDDWADLLPTVTAVRRVSDAGPIGVGARFQVRQPGLAPAVYEVTEWAPGQAFTWVARTPVVTTTARHAVVPAPEGSRLDLTLAWSGPLAAPVRWLFGRKARAMVETEAATFVAAAGG